MLHYIHVDHEGECNINREGLLTILQGVISIDRVWGTLGWLKSLSSES